MSAPLPSAAPWSALQQRSAFLADVIAGLQRSSKALSCKYLYDARGSALFERICGLPEYYLTRVELEIMRRHAPEMAASLGPRALLVEPGSGASRKTRLLLRHLEDVAAYLPVDISPSALDGAARELRLAFPQLQILPVCADFSEPFTLPAPQRAAERTVIYFPGSTIGNLDPGDAARLLRRLGGLCGAAGAVLVGVDLHKGTPALEAAYNDGQGVTAAFNMNILARINAELGADFELARFSHRAIYNEELRRIEMHLESVAEQSVHLAGHTFHFRRGELLHTEWSYKYTLASFRDLAERAGLRVARVWTDEGQRFSVQCLRLRAWERLPLRYRRRSA